MKIFHKIIQSTFLVTTSPALMAHSVAEFPTTVVQQAYHKPIHIPDLRTLSYDEVVDLLAWIESDSFGESHSIDELDQINQFISFLAMEGVTDDEKIDMAQATASLFRKNDLQYASLMNPDFGYTIQPAIYFEDFPDIVLCKSWVKKQWNHTRAFVKKHKKAIIIGTIIVVTVAVVVVSAVVISSAAAGTAAASGLASVGSVAGSSDSNQTPSNESIASSWQEQASSFKETIAKEQFSAVSELSGISIEENGRIIGSLFAHKTIDTFTASAAGNPSIANELKDLGFNSQSPPPKWQTTYPGNSPFVPHYSTDSAFSTDYTVSYAGNFGDLNAMSYQARGNLALNAECYPQALQDFGKAISLDPNNPTLYLERGIANFELGNYESSITDYSQYIEKKGEPLSITDFSVGFAKGVPKGVYESGKGALLFLSDFITHPVQTSKQVVDSLSQLATLVKNDEFGVVAEALSPELHQLVTHWDTLPSESRGELAGYAVGKLGTDLMAPGAVAKIASKSVNSAKELVAICKNLQIAQETLLLETASGIGIPAKISEIVEMGKKTATLGEELGFTTQEIAQLQKAGKLDTTVAKACEHLSPSMKESFQFFKKAQDFLEHYKGFIPEAQARELIHQTGVRTFPRPLGIPENFKVQISSKGAGMEYVHPTNPHIRVRIMPGKPHSPLPHQQKPYVVQTKEGKALDRLGNKTEAHSPEAHIPYEEFVYRG
ncbi:MAG: tetratricopeptide repeat protein [Verrucomicrobiota bacterium]|nr:tetratricopeptide repeat protein [Verrucomicrobiota bacterium]